MKVKLVARTPMQKNARDAVKKGKNNPIAKRYMARFTRPTRPEGDLPSL
jgi:hypothetical protein